MKEIEIKILEINPDLVRDLLLKNGGQMTFQGKVLSQYYDYQDSRLRKINAIIRLRKRNLKIELSYKRNLSVKNYMINENLDLRVENVEKCDWFLRLFGLECVSSQKFEMTEIFIDNTKLYIVEYPNIPAYLEIEGENIEEIIKTFKLDNYQRSTLSAFELHKIFYKKPIS